MKALIRKLQRLAGLFAAAILIQPQISSAQVDTATISLATKAPILSKTSEEASIGRDLAALIAEYELFVQTAGVNQASRFRSSNRFIGIADGYVVIDAVAAGDPSELQSELESLKTFKLGPTGKHYFRTSATFRHSDPGQIKEIEICPARIFYDSCRKCRQPGR